MALGVVAVGGGVALAVRLRLDAIEHVERALRRPRRADQGGAGVALLDHVADAVVLELRGRGLGAAVAVGSRLQAVGRVVDEAGQTALGVGLRDAVAVAVVGVRLDDRLVRRQAERTRDAHDAAERVELRPLDEAAAVLLEHAVAGVVVRDDHRLRVERGGVGRLDQPVDRVVLEERRVVRRPLVGLLALVDAVPAERAVGAERVRLLHHAVEAVEVERGLVAAGIDGYPTARGVEVPRLATPRDAAERRGLERLRARSADVVVGEDASDAAAVRLAGLEALAVVLGGGGPTGGVGREDEPAEAVVAESRRVAVGVGDGLAIAEPVVARPGDERRARRGRRSSRTRGPGRRAASGSRSRAGR